MASTFLDGVKQVEHTLSSRTSSRTDINGFSRRMECPAGTSRVVTNPRPSEESESSSLTGELVSLEAMEAVADEDIFITAKSSNPTRGCRPVLGPTMSYTSGARGTSQKTGVVGAHVRPMRRQFERGKRPATAGKPHNTLLHPLPAANKIRTMTASELYLLMLQFALNYFPLFIYIHELPLCHPILICRPTTGSFALKHKI
jgi:hypothetical protein